MRVLLIVLTLAFTALFWSQSHAQEKSKFFQGLQLNPAAQQRLGYFSSCCDAGDTVKVQFRVNKVNGADEWWYLWKGMWKRVPPDIISDKRSPYGALLFISINDYETPVCFIPPDVGG